MLFTGGGLELFNNRTKTWSAYFQTAKRIFEFSKAEKTVKGRNFPILGICQGYEVLGIIANNDDPRTLSYQKSFDVMQSVEWLRNPAETQMFKDFESNLLQRMESENLVYHFHEWCVGLDKIQAQTEKGANNRIEIISAEKHSDPDVTLVSAFQFTSLPIFASMYHPEYVLATSVEGSSLKFPVTEETMQIRNNFAKLLAREA